MNWILIKLLWNEFISTILSSMLSHQQIIAGKRIHIADCLTSQLGNKASCHYLLFYVYLSARIAALTHPKPSLIVSMHGQTMFCFVPTRKKKCRLVLSSYYKWLTLGPLLNLCTYPFFIFNLSENLLTFHTLVVPHAECFPWII